MLIIKSLIKKKEPLGIIYHHTIGTAPYTTQEQFTIFHAPMLHLFTGGH